ncbi:hypothetical protein NPX13_g6193 [Xylaria arbuscula]|uniref:Uncharacterized protein n=1 Tax=Xylaria arbuscula TaxID=114810 RepID=A0A9W8ND35_9PEZI|nr:hypothetical protein NPX13_g6193 [Xylaria arbuscula]
MYDRSVTGGLHTTDKEIGGMQRDNKLQEWWWDCSIEEFIIVVIGAVVRRYWRSVAQQDDKTPNLVIFDRGTIMFRAVAIAMVAIKRRDDDLDAARSVFNSVMQKYGLVLPNEDFAVLLRHDSCDIGVGVQRTMRRGTDSHDERYRHYQRLLQTELHNQQAGGDYQRTILVSEQDSFRELQNKLRQALLGKTKNTLFRPLMHPVQTIYGFSGLSESGKSSHAQAFCNGMGAQHAFRSKIVYFNGAISRRLGKSIYSHSSEEQALHFLHELERFATAHYWLRYITIESLHSHEVTRFLKLWLGDGFQVIHIAVDNAKRRSRSLISLEELERQDQIKKERGVGIIAAEADFVLDNNGSFESAEKSLLLFANDIASKGTRLQGQE